MEYAPTLQLPSGKLPLPQFLPDATLGQIRGVDAKATKNCGIKSVMMNTFHLMQKPGSATIKSLGGLKHMTGWDGMIFMDSGGFQAYSLIRQNKKNGSLTDNGIIFYPGGEKRKYLLTPEKCIQLQISFGADALFCLDDCTHVEESPNEQIKSVERTIHWASRCKQEYERLMEEKKLAGENQPKLFGVIQGGDSPDLRKQCADALLEIGFDGYGYGGWPLDSQNKLVAETLQLVRDLVPAIYPLHALGIGHPPYVVQCYQMGYRLFDCAMPTRDARHGRLYRFAEAIPSVTTTNNDWFAYEYINDQKHIKSSQPIDTGCSCEVCANYSAGYLRHLFKINDSLYQRLASIHNMRFMARLMDVLRVDPSIA